ncbi:hypothetical protein SEVIR_9G503000v4 [Setaria viridis]|uniref:BTB domain-containing protein n=1 Tax=Setaria viridis TaxID=4556 RepID=A0A4V6D284_SETVI|nr:BTB/POZ and MATH domain-containing protein 1-like [Setaria viridis]TKV97565.1 hypothetical protein SEVIR_9G503000v2 [Setaria viridis]
MPSASGRRKPSRSSSAIVADKERGRHELRIDAGTLDAAAPAGERGLLASSPFTVGGHRWRVRYYPNGADAESKGWVSIFLFLDEDVAEPVTARFRLSLVTEVRALFCIKCKAELLSKPEAQYNFTSRGTWGYSKFEQRQTVASLVRRREVDRFSIRCDIVVLNGFRTKEEAPSAAIPPSDLQKHLGDFLQSGRGTDVVFEVGGEAFAAHRCVLAARSPVISADLLGAASDGAAAAGVVRVDGVETRAFKALLRYAYTDSLPEMDREEEDAILRNVAADRYSLQRLKLICEDRLCRLVSVGTVKITLALAEQHKCDRLKEACLQFLGAPANLRAAMGARGQ